MVKYLKSIFRSPKMLKNYSIFNIKPGRNDSTFIDPAVKLHHNFLGPVVVNDFKLTNVA